ncbi:hypothetical protein JIN84_00375 [Luteolibacter yonseiensis]|uniref:Uncharacterized protein n=2 Tax=Luteolibacter yonseiensis TaxID=1144680 RepID=A0A934QZT0_9BACT|nr:hypothetical protein [Luteolibacter yonseiensis]MBK1814062.1 hypothetical protein [Luteolibacter yonseiensis]
MIILLFLIAMVAITFSPFIVERFGGIKVWSIQAYRWKTFIGECLRGE